MMPADSHPNRSPVPIRIFLLNWACIFPLVLTLNEVVGRSLAGLHLPNWVLVGIVTGLLTLGMVFFVDPWLRRTFRTWLNKP